MANICFNIAKGRVKEFYNRVESNDPTNSALILVPIETSGLESDATLIDKDDLAAVLSGTTNEQTTLAEREARRARMDISRLRAELPARRRAASMRAIEQMLGKL